MEHLAQVGYGRDTDRVTVHFGPHETTTIVGWVYAEALRSANWERRRAFDRIPSYAALEPAGNHPARGATEAELRLGCPAWPVK